MPHNQRRNRNSKTSFKKKVLAIVNSKKELHSKASAVNTDTSIVAGGSHARLSSNLQLAQGTDDDERIGDLVAFKDITFQVGLQPGLAGLGNGVMARVKVVQYLEFELSSVVKEIEPYEFYPNYQASDTKYRILFDRTYALSANGRQAHYQTIRIPGSKLQPVEFDDAAATEAKGSIECSITTDTTTANELSGSISLRGRWYNA